MNNKSNNNKIVFDGWIEVICGPMFSGKTEELLKRLDKIKYSKEKYIVFKPRLDTRSTNEIMSRHKRTNIAIEIDNPLDILNILEQDEIKKENYKVIAIDEVQFLNNDIVKVCQELTKKEYHLIIAGLDKNYKAEPFGSMPQILAIADSTTKLAASCTVCGARATFTYRNNNTTNDSEILVGDNDIYEARCYQHYYKD